MIEYNFIFKFKLDHHFDLESHLAALCEAGCDDSLVGCGNEGWLAMDFTRTAETSKAAIESAMTDVRAVMGDSALIEIEYNTKQQSKEFWDRDLDNSVDGMPIENILNDFAKNLIENQEDLGPEFQKVLDDNYWDLITDNEKDK